MWETIDVSYCQKRNRNKYCSVFLISLPWSVRGVCVVFVLQDLQWEQSWEITHAFNRTFHKIISSGKLLVLLFFARENTSFPSFWVLGQVLRSVEHWSCLSLNMSLFFRLLSAFTGIAEPVGTHEKLFGHHICPYPPLICNPIPQMIWATGWLWLFL